MVVVVVAVYVCNNNQLLNACYDNIWLQIFSILCVCALKINIIYNETDLLFTTTLAAILQPIVKKFQFCFFIFGAGIKVEVNAILNYDLKIMKLYKYFI